MQLPTGSVLLGLFSSSVLLSWREAKGLAEGLGLHETGDTVFGMATRTCPDPNSRFL